MRKRFCVSGGAKACTSADAADISTCTTALATPNPTALAECMNAADGTWDGECTSALWCPYLKSVANCYPGSCCTAELSAGWKTQMDGLKTSNGVTCDADTVACASTTTASPSTVSGASGTSTPLAALAATLLVLVATRG